MILQYFVTASDTGNKIPVEIEKSTSADLAATKESWQTDWTSEFIGDPALEKYTAKTESGEIVALGAYRETEASMFVYIEYIESHPESNPTLTAKRKYLDIGRMMIAFGIQLSIDSGKNGVKYYALCVDNKPLSEICANPVGNRYILPVIQRKRRFQTLIHDENINNLLLGLFQEYEKKEPAYELAIQADIILLFALLNRFYIDNSENQIVIDTHFEQVLTYINEHFTENISTESISKKFAFNKCHFCRKIKSQTGMSFVRYLNQLRMDLACSLLTTTDKPITMVAVECGYNDLNYFSRKFHEFYSMTASEFRQQSNLS